MAHLRASLFWLGLVPSTLMMATLLVLLRPLPFLWRQRFSTLWPAFNLWWLRVTCRLDYRVEGMENIQPGPAIYLCKHQSAWETLVMELVVPPMVWVLKRELMWIPVFGWALAALKPIAINRRQGRQARDQLLQQGEARLRRGISVVIFPEGTRVAPGMKGRYRIGGALLAEKTGFPVVPMAHNAGYYWPRREFTKRPGTVRMVVGPPLDPKGLSADEINRRVEDWIETAVAEIAPPGHGAPPHGPAGPGRDRPS